MQVRQLGWLVLAVASCSRSFTPPESGQLSLGAVSAEVADTTQPNGSRTVARDGDQVTIAFSASEKLQSCSAQVGGLSATCAPDGTGCRCTLLVVAVLPEGRLDISVTGANADGSAIGSGTLQVDRTPPVVNPALISIARNAPGSDDAVDGAASSVVDGNDYQGQRVTEVRLRESSSPDGQIRGWTVPAADGSFHIELANTGQHSPPALWVTAVDAAHNESDPVEVLSGEDDGGPVIDGSRVRIVRTPIGDYDRLEIPADAVTSICAPSAFEVELDDGGVTLLQLLPNPDGGIASVTVGDPSHSFQQLWVAAHDKCGAAGTRVEASNGDTTAPTIDGAMLTWYRRPWGTVERISGVAGSIVDPSVDGVSAVREIRVYDGPDSGARVLAQGFGLDAGAFDQTLDLGSAEPKQLWVEATDKAGNVSERVYARLVDATLNLSGRERYVDSKSPVAFYAFGSPFDLRTQPAGPGIGPALVPEAVEVSGLAAADSNPLTTHVAPLNLPPSSWVGDRPGNPPYVQLGNDTLYGSRRAIYFDPILGKPVLFERYNSNSIYGPTGSNPNVWTYSNGHWTKLQVSGGPVVTDYEALDAVWDPALGMGLLAACVNQSLQTWTFDGATWTQVALGPAPACVSTTVALAYDEALAEPILVTRQPSYPNTVVVLGFANGSWHPITAATTPIAGNYNAQASDLALAYDAKVSKLVLFTSASPTTDANGDSIPQNTWLYDGSDWSAAGGTAAPSPRFQVAMYYDASLQKIVLFGGVDESNAVGSDPTLSDVWSFDGVAWSEVASSTPLGARDNTMITERGAGPSFWFGGETGVQTIQAVVQEHSDAWSFNGSTWVSEDLPRPPARFEHGLVFDNQLGKTVLFGGYSPNAGRLFADTWTFDGTAWTQVAVSPPPELKPRYGHAMAYDARSGRIILFGGADASGVLNDTWSFDGSQWTQIETAHHPPERYEHAMTYDAARGRVVLFGGWNGGLYYSDTWEFDGQDWTETTRPISPAGRHMHSLAYDPRSAKVILFGGLTVLGPFGDSWEYDGSTWTQLQNTPAASDGSPFIPFAG